MIGLRELRKAEALDRAGDRAGRHAAVKPPLSAAYPVAERVAETAAGDQTLGSAEREVGRAAGKAARERFFSALEQSGAPF